MAAVRHLVFLGILIFNCRYGSHSKYVPQCHYIAPIAQAVAEIWPLLHFSRWRPSAILDF